jgi:putative membrane protein
MPAQLGNIANRMIASRPDPCADPRPDLRAGVSVCRMVLIIMLWSKAGTQHALAHSAPLNRRVGWRDWNGDLALLLSVTLVGWLYARGWARFRRMAGAGRVVTAWHACAFAVGLLTVALCLLSPIDPLSDQLALAHMVQHMLLMVVAAPLVMLGAPHFVGMWGLSLRARRKLGRLWNRSSSWRVLSQLAASPLVVWFLYALAMWGWHLPTLYQAAMRHEMVHDLQHLSFFVAACLFWRVMLDPIRQSRMNQPLAVLYLFTTMVHATLLGVFMTVAPRVWYDEYIGRTELWGLTALEDQQIAGLIMWMPACATYPVVAIALLAHYLQRLAPDAGKRQRNVTETIPTTAVES